MELYCAMERWMGCWNIANNFPFLDVELNKELRRCILGALKKSAWMLVLDKLHCSIPWGVERLQFM